MKLAPFNEFILEIEQSPYPPYHKGFYMERYFIDFYIKNRKSIDDTGYQFLPITWTDIYVHKPHLRYKLQDLLNSLDKEKKYFTVSQHDDAPLDDLPSKTLKFSAGGNQKNCIPIPLICSSLENIKETKKDIFCSFVGSITHPVRLSMLHYLKANPNYVLLPKNWSSNVENEKQDLFLNVTSRSKFTLCPRGYGSTSFRLYESMQLGSIPVYIYYDTPYVPFADELDWNKLSVLIHANDIINIDNILNSITVERYNEMLSYIKEIYPKYFTLEGMCDKILKTIQNIK
jgi:hypothetical protein